MAFIREPLLLLSFAVSFLSALFVLPHWIAHAKRAGLVGIDIHKHDKPKIAEIGGIIVIFSFLLGVLFYIGIRTFYFNDSEYILAIMSILSTILIITIIGLIDDILGWKIGLKQWQKPLLTLFAAFPIMVVNAGHSTMSIPLIGFVDFAFIYPLFIVPLAIVGASNGFNMLAGYNGLETGQGILILSTLAYIAWKSQQGWISLIALCMVFSLVAFFLFNKYPSKVFPGDTLTYSVGALIALVAIFANAEKAALVLFIPYFIEFFLKLRGKFKKESFAKLDENQNLILPYEKIYGLEHLSILFLRKFTTKVTENKVVYSLFTFQLFFIIIVLVAL
jgi:UDP-N-acetylglucosamine--dolichyl-phosphate N-acetylglucosaminephosphotransferase